MRKILVLVAVLVLVLAAGEARAQVGNLIWEENFNNLDNWIKLTGNGSWGWGNGELEFYQNENVDIADVPGEPGNKALRIIAKQESGPGIVDQWGNPLSYTSGKVMSKSFVSVKYGMIEARVWVPNLNLGGWPAVWLLGTANYAWPRCGEIDMMEMGLKKAYRDLHDTHNGGNGLGQLDRGPDGRARTRSTTPTPPSRPENPSGAASLSWDPDRRDYCRPYYNYANPLVGRFLTYRLYWDKNTMRQTVVDDGVEHDLFADPFTIGERVRRVPAAVLPDRQPGHRRRVHRRLPARRPRPAACRSRCRSRARCTWTTSGSTGGTARARSTSDRPRRRAAPSGS